MSDHRVTSVKIVNNSGINFASVGVVHKYSDNYKNSYLWENVANGVTTGADMTVDYNTGFMTTGTDWWYVMATAEDGTKYITDPSNATWLLDIVNKGISGVVEPMATGIVAGSAFAGQAEVAAPVAAAKFLLEAVVNEESVEGFKEFMLRKEDETSPVSITLTSSEVIFQAPSGTASTPLKASGHR
jgi:hypothetical protein